MRALHAILWALVGALLFYRLQPDPPAPDYPRVIVHRDAIERLEPDTVIRWKDRVRYVLPAPLQVATAPGGATELVRSFCAPIVLRERGDTTSAPRALLLRSGSLDRGGPFRAAALRLTGPTSDGDLLQGTWRTHGDASWRVVGDSVLVRYDRFWLPKEAAPYVLAIGLTWLLAR